MLIERSVAQKNRRMLIWGALLTLAMFGFGFALVPIYNVLCSVTGLNGKTRSEAVPPLDPSQIVYNRSVTVEFVTTLNADLAWKFYPLKNTVTIHPGENKLVYFFAENDTGKGMTVQAIPSVAPGQVARYLKKTECFCFSQQYLKKGESMRMPVLFHLDPNFPKEINTMTLSYTLFDADNFKKKTGITGKIG